MQLAVVAVAEHPAEILVEQRNAVAQIVEHRLHDLMRPLDLVARASAASLEVASACSRSFSSVMSRMTAMTSPFRQRDEIGIRDAGRQPCAARNSCRPAWR